MSIPRKTILFSGMIAADPHQGGATWAVLQYVLGLRQLGHDVFFIEPVPAKSLRPQAASLQDSVNAAYFKQIIRDFGLDGCAALLVEETQQTVGLSYDELRDVARRADALINVSGMLRDEALFSPRTRIYLDLDPAFIQLWHATQGVDMHFEGHTHFVTVGQAIGSSGCSVPTCGRAWIGTLQPIVLSHWPVAGNIVHDALTTVGNWRGYGSIEHAGVLYGQKAHSLRPLMELPKRAKERFLLAMSIHPQEQKDLEALAANGWEIVDPQAVANSPVAYQRFIAGSRAEFGIAKSGYVASRCGWFSDRSVCYLASGRPVIAQETGFSRFIPTGAGLLPFTTMDDAVSAIDSIRQDYPLHARAARALAEAHFDSDKVLTRLLTQTQVI